MGLRWSENALCATPQSPSEMKRVISMEYADAQTTRAPRRRWCGATMDPANKTLTFQLICHIYVSAMSKWQYSVPVDEEASRKMPILM